METTGSTTTNSVTIQWGFCTINPIVQVLEHFYNQRKKNG